MKVLSRQRGILRDGALRHLRERSFSTWLLALGLLSGCRDWDSLTDGLARVANLPPDEAFSTGGVLALDGGVIDTSTLTLLGQVLPDGVRFDAVDAGVELAVLRVSTLTLVGRVRVRGARPLVVLAREDIVIDGVLDGAARGTEPGPGADLEGQGPGGAAETSGSLAAGAGGAGHASSGGAGGAVPALLAGAGGSAYGSPESLILEPGSRGGRGGRSACVVRGGGGGGALQLFAGRRLVVNEGGAITVGGGGGEDVCEPCRRVSFEGGGAGGGSGGTLLLQSPVMELRGVLAANGGGGSGTCDRRSSAGADGLESDRPAPGGAGRGPPCCGEGAPGGAGTTPPGVGGEGGAMAGGGGGAVGRVRIVTRAGSVVLGTISPSPVLRAW
ncbi:MAG: hypothetical protein Q8S33_01610 [Myxococcales bacterium]|nr:hypothetical protein [Myxococcales bacterium]